MPRPVYVILVRYKSLILSLAARQSIKPPTPQRIFFIENINKQIAVQSALTCWLGQFTSKEPSGLQTSGLSAEIVIAGVVRKVALM